MSSVFLPVLPFGERSAVLETDITRYAGRLSKVISGLKAYDPVKGSAGFGSKSSMVVINGLSIAHGLLCNPDCNITVTKAALGEPPPATRIRKLNNH